MRRLPRWEIFLLPVAEVSYFQFVKFIPEPQKPVPDVQIYGGDGPKSSEA